jgi:hypothetical protein
MTDEAAKLLRELHASGQTGLAILIVILAVLILAGIGVFLLQRRFITLTVEAQKVIDAKMRAADTMREESRKSQEFYAADVIARINALSTINDELRKEIERLSVQQKGLRDSQAAFRMSVKDSISIGLQDIKDRMTSLTVNEILSQIPDAFKDDLQLTVADATKQVVADVTNILQKSPSDLIDYEAITRELEGRLRKVLQNIRLPYPDPIHGWNGEYNQFWDQYAEQLAFRVARHLRRYI